MATTDTSTNTSTDTLTDTVTDTPWEPPLAGTELAAVLGALERMRATFRYKVDDLDAAGLDSRLGVSTLTLGGLLKHLAVNEDHKFSTKLSGAPMDPVWDDNGWDDSDDWEFESAAEDTPQRLYALYDAAVARSRASLAAYLGDAGLDHPAHVSDGAGNHANVRRLLLDMVEEYGRHTGQADLLREAVDGRVGEDPPPGWQPVSGAWEWPAR